MTSVYPAGHWVDTGTRHPSEPGVPAGLIGLWVYTEAPASSVLGWLVGWLQGEDTEGHGTLGSSAPHILLWAQLSFVF